MKPNLFRSISNSLAEQFPLVPRIRRSFIGLLMFCLLFLSIGFSESKGITMPIVPRESGAYANRSIAIYEGSIIKLGGQLTISDPGFWERLLLPHVITDLDMLTLVFMALASIIIIWMAPKLQQQNLFRKDISNSIRLLGYLIMLHGILSLYRILVYGPGKIESLTHNQFTSQRGFPITVSAELYFSLIVIALGSMYQRGVKLQQEQDLTV